MNKTLEDSGIEVSHAMCEHFAMSRAELFKMVREEGLRAPHEFKFGVSGCARECAEARGKDVGVIATETGWTEELEQTIAEHVDNYTDE